MKIKKGICHLCGLKGELNYEHVPPRSAFNKRTKFSEAPLLDYLQSPNPLKYNYKGFVKQGGIGFYSFCPECNNFLGQHYVKAYRDFVLLNAEMKNLEDSTFLFNNFKIFPNRIIKQIISMFLAMNPIEFSQAYPELAAFTLDRASTQLHDKYKLYMYLAKGPNIRYSPISFKRNFKNQSKTMISCTELAFPPFGFVLLIDSDSMSSELTEITNFKKFDPDQENEISIRLRLLETHLNFPLDYRSKSKLEKVLGK